jgi:hypothetical protein
MQSYLDNFWPDLKAARELCDSILQSRRERESESQESHGKEYPEHLPPEVLEAGIKSGCYVQVRVLMQSPCQLQPASSLALSLSFFFLSLLLFLFLSLSLPPSLPSSPTSSSLPCPPHFL